MSKEKSKLHELLAVESDTESTYKKVIEEAIITFLKKADHFFGMHKVLTMFDDTKQKDAICYCSAW